MFRATIIVTSLLLTTIGAGASPVDTEVGQSGTAEYPRLLAQVSTLTGKEDAQLIAIDVKPGSESNEIRIRNERAFPIAIFGSPTLEVTKINPRTIRVTAAAKKLVGRADTRSCRREDVNGDALEDLICNVKTVAFRLDAGELLLTLVAETYDHEPLRAESTILIVAD